MSDGGVRIEAGKWHRMRDGGRAFIAGRSAADVRFEYGSTWIGETDSGSLCRWRDDGRLCRYVDAESDLDIVGEWREPVRGEVWVVVRRPTGGSLSITSLVYPSEIAAWSGLSGADTLEVLAVKRVKWVEGELEWSGDDGLGHA